MSTKLEERIAKSKERTAKLERMRREELRKEREQQKKKNQRRNYIVGELVVNYFPEIKKMEPGTNSENAKNFAELDAFLSFLSSDKCLVESLRKRAHCNILSNQEK